VIIGGFQSPEVRKKEKEKSPDSYIFGNSLWVAKDIERMIKDFYFYFWFIPGFG